MKQLLILLAVLVSLSTFSQNILFDPVSNKVFNPDKYSSVSGSPFVVDKWQKGSVTTAKGIYKDLLLKLDAYSNTVLFNKDDQAYEFQDPVTMFTIEASKDTQVFRKGLTGPSLKPEQFVQVLVDGKTSLYRSDIKLFAEINQINKGLVKSFTTSTRYFLVKDGTVQLIKLNKSELLAMLADRRSELETTISKEKLDLRRQSDVVSLVKTYNSL